MLLVSMQKTLRIRYPSLELVEVVKRAVDWPAEMEDICSKKNKIIIIIIKKRTNASCLLVHYLNYGDRLFFS